MGVKSWEQLTDRERSLFDWIDLQEGETMSDWWDVYCEMCEEEGSDPLDMEA